MPNISNAAIADAGPLIHLDEVGWLFVLETFATVWVPPAVAEEATRHRPNWKSSAPANLLIEVPSQEAWEWWQAEKNFVGLDAGEKAALALWRSHQDAILLCDDLQARTVAQDFGVPVMGTLGLILRVAQLSLRPISEVRAILNDLPKRSTLHLKPALLHRVLDSLPDE
jgi:predicted nucleic acid-binding protein